MSNKIIRTFGMLCIISLSLVGILIVNESSNSYPNTHNYKINKDYSHKAILFLTGFAISTGSISSILIFKKINKKEYFSYKKMTMIDMDKDLYYRVNHPNKFK